MCNTHYLNHSNIKIMLYGMKSRSKKLCYEIYNNQLSKSQGGEYIKTALDITFDNLFNNQIQNMMGEFNHYYIIQNGKVTIDKMKDLENTLIELYEPKCSVRGILEYIVNIACRQVFIDMLNHIPLNAVNV